MSDFSRDIVSLSETGDSDLHRVCGIVGDAKFSDSESCQRRLLGQPHKLHHYSLRKK